MISGPNAIIEEIMEKVELNFMIQLDGGSNDKEAELKKEKVITYDS